jgi:lipoprotein NlpI
MSEEDFLATAQDKDQKTKTNFYTGMVNLLDGKRAEAKERFEWVIKNGTREFIEYHYAVRELQDLQQ